jgi:hypothetical protein
MMTKRRAWVAAVAGLIALALPIGWAWGDNVRIEVAPQPQPPPSSTTVIVPPPAPPATQYVPAPPQVAVPMPPQTITADQIKANQVRADTIYANRIEADQVFGQVHQTRDVKIRDGLAREWYEDVSRELSVHLERVRPERPSTDQGKEGA